MSEWICITGASSGIGQAYAIEEAKNGHALVLAGRNKERLNITKLACLGAGASQVETFIGDLSDATVIDNFVDFCAHLGEIRALVHSAGFGEFIDISEQSTENIEKLVQTNLLATMFIAKRFAFEMLTQNIDFANITLISSIAAKLQTPKSAVYSASKAGVYAFANGLRQDLWNTPIDVTVILPGPTDTAFFKTADEGGNYFENVKSFSTDPETVAKRMVVAIKHGKQEVVVPRYYDFLSRVSALAPALTNTIIHYMYDEYGFRD